MSPDGRLARVSPFVATAALGLLASPLAGQADERFRAGEPLDLMSNTRVFGSFHFTESCSYDPVGDRYVTPSLGNRGEPINHQLTSHSSARCDLSFILLA